MISANTASFTSSASPRTSGSSERPWSQCGRLDPGELADRRVEVELGDERVDDRPPWKPPGPRMISSTPMPRSVERRLRAREGEAVVGGEDHERVVGEAVLVERVEHRADALVERARAGLEGRHVAPRLAACRGGSPAAASRARRARSVGLEVVAVGLEEADREEERLRPRRRASSSRGGRGDVVDVGGVDLDDVVVADVVRVARRRAARRSAPTSSRPRAACGRGGGA